MLWFHVNKDILFENVDLIWARPMLIWKKETEKPKLCHWISLFSAAPMRLSKSYKNDIKVTSTTYQKRSPFFSVPFHQRLDMSDWIIPKLTKTKQQQNHISLWYKVLYNLCQVKFDEIFKMIGNVVMIFSCW